MEPLAIAGYVAIATAALDAVVVGALGGAIAWTIKRSVLWVGLLAAGGYLAAMVFLASTRLAAAAVIGLPPLVLALLTSWLTANHLAARARLRPIWAALLGLGCALILGLLDLLLFRLSFTAPIAFAVAADAFLIPVVFLTRRRNPVRP